MPRYPNHACTFSNLVTLKFFIQTEVPSWFQSRWNVLLEKNFRKQQQTKEPPRQKRDYIAMHTARSALPLLTNFASGKFPLESHGISE